MKNKLLVNVYIPQIDEDYDIYIPLNKNVANIIDLIGSSISEIKRTDKFDFNTFELYNMETGIRYLPDKVIKETTIRNGTRLILM